MFAVIATVLPLLTACTRCSVLKHTWAVYSVEGCSFHATRTPLLGGARWLRPTRGPSACVPPDAGRCPLRAPGWPAPSTGRVAHCNLTPQAHIRCPLKKGGGWGDGVGGPECNLPPSSDTTVLFCTPTAAQGCALSVLHLPPMMYHMGLQCRCFLVAASTCFGLARHFAVLWSVWSLGQWPGVATVHPPTTLRRRVQLRRFVGERVNPCPGIPNALTDNDHRNGCVHSCMPACSCCGGTHTYRPPASPHTRRNGSACSRVAVLRAGRHVRDPFPAAYLRTQTTGRCRTRTGSSSAGTPAPCMLAREGTVPVSVVHRRHRLVHLASYRRSRYAE